MSTEFVQSGYIEVWRDGEMFSRHRVEREAVESALADSENRGSGEYELRFPQVRIIVKRPITQPEAPALGTVYALSTTSLGVPLDRPATGPTQIDEYVLDRRLYGAVSFTEIARGLAIFGSMNVYTDTGLTADTQYEYRCKAVDTTERESEWSAPAFGQTTTAVEIYAPINVSAVSISGGIRVSWSPPASGLTPTSYEVQRTYAVDGTWSVKTTQAGTTYDDTDVAAGVAKWYRIVAINGSNRSDYSATVTAVGGAASGTEYKKWHPGHGLLIKSDTGTATALSEMLAQISANLNDSEYLTWVHYRPRWGRLNTTGSTYSWAPVESICNAAGTKRVIIDITYKGFGGVDDYIGPLDLMGELIATGSGWIMPVWRPAIMDRFIAYVTAMGAAYDEDPQIEGLVMCESAPSLTVPFPADYSRSALATQLKRLYSAAVAAWSHTSVFSNLNSLSGELVGLLEHAHTEGLGFSTPDAVDTNGVRLFRGETVAGEGTPDMDHRGVMPHLELASSPVLGGKDDNGPPSNIINWAQTNSVSHLGWYAGGTSTYSWASILLAIESDPLLYTACPTVFNGTCDGS